MNTAYFDESHDDCKVCGANVREDNQQRHADWHRQLTGSLSGVQHALSLAVQERGGMS